MNLSHPVLFGFALACAAASLNAAAPKTTEELFRTTNIWKVQLKFAADQWKAMEPAGGDNFGPFGGGPGRGPGGPGGPGPGGPGGPGGFGPAMMIAPAFMQAGDENKDGKLSGEEFAGIGKKWFTAWDKDKAGKITGEQLRAGLNATMGPPGGPGGMRMNLQGAPGQRNGIAARAGVDHQYVHADMMFEDRTLPNVAARHKGNGTFLQSRRSDKKPMKVDLNKYVKGQKLGGVSTVNLHNSVTDPSWMNETLSFQLYRDAGVPAPRTSYARLNITAPGEHENEYFGLYTIVENIDGNFTEERFQTKGGAIFKPVTPNLFEDLGDDWAAYKQTFDPKDDPSKAETARVIEACRFVTKATDEEFAARLGEFIDLEAFARYMAVTVYLSDLDGILGPGQNFYLFLHPKTRQFHFIAWDQDHSFGQMRGSQEEREHLSIHKPWQGENRFLERVYKVEAFKRAYLARLEEFSKSLFKAEGFHQQVDSMAPVLRGAIKEESLDKLEQFEAVVRGETPARGGFGPFGSAKPIKAFVAARSESVAAQVAGKSEGLRVGSGFGGGGPGGRGPRGGGPGGFGMGMLMGNGMMKALDADADAALTAAEVTGGFAKWFTAWNTDKTGALTEEQLRAGINKDLNPFPPGGPGPFGPPR